MLQFLDYLLDALHIVVILFNCTGWIWQYTRKLHFVVILMTAFSWFVLGIKYGWGYCFLTDWAWQVKRQLGEIDLPSSYVQYIFEKVGLKIDPVITDLITATIFFVSLGIAIILNVNSRKQKLHR